MVSKNSQKKYICFFLIFHLWFNGKLLLEKQIYLFKENKDINIKFCLCWTNENWANG